MFSIITTTYRHEEFIAQTIGSIVSQSFTDWELLIWDDSPDDATWKIIQKYVVLYPDKIHAWHHVPNRGIVDNMNFLIAQAHPNSKYITFLEWDDRYISDSLSEKNAIFQKYSQVDLVYSDMDFINSAWDTTLSWLLRSQGVRFYQNEIIPVEDYISAMNPLIVSYSSVSIRKSTLDRYLPILNPTGSKTYSVSDYDLFFRISREKCVYGITRSLTQYRRHSGNLSASYLGLFEDLSGLIDSYFQKKLITAEVYHRKISWISILQSISYLSQWDKKRAFQSMKDSFLRMPFSYLLYKTAISILLIFPVSFAQWIIKRKIRRWT
jgi:glycosyltransferase involved in cell wall biosynthesis